jgi:uncharacterized delta-60 repeat protein
MRRNLRTLGGGFAASVCLMASTGAAAASQSGLLDLTFTPDPAISASVDCIAVQADRGLIVAGCFESLRGVSLHTTPPRASTGYILRLTASGEKDDFFKGVRVESPASSVPPSHVRCLVTQADGRVLVGGPFVAVDQFPAKGLARLNADGTVDSRFNPGEWFKENIADVRALALQPDGKILVGGAFSGRFGVVGKNLARFNPDGSLDVTFDVGQGADDAVNAIAVAPGGAIWIGGCFSTVNNAACQGLAMLQPNGQIDATFNRKGLQEAIPYLSVAALAITSDGKVLVAGEMNHWDPRLHHGLIRLTPGGSLDSSFAPAPELGQVVHFLAQHCDGRMVVHGWFQTADGVQPSRVFQLLPDGGLDLAFLSDSLPGEFISCAATDLDGRVLIGGRFREIRGRTRLGLARLTGGVAPAVLVQPEPREVLPGNPVQFRLGVAGSEPLAFEWWKNGQPLAPPQTNATLVISKTQDTDAGQYSVQVSNPFGSVTSQSAELKVVSEANLPIIVLQPQRQRALAESTVVFRVVACGTEPLTYQWTRNGANLPGATGAALQLASIQPKDAGEYAVSIANPAGDVTSQPAALTVVSPPRIVRQPSTQRFWLGDSVTLTVAVEGTEPLAFQWLRDGAILPGATSSSLTLRNLTRADAGRYTLLAANSSGRTASQVIPLVVVGAGALDLDFHSDLAGEISSVAVQADGKILVAGGDLLSSNPARTPVARLSPDGSLDIGFQPTISMSWFCDTCFSPWYARAYEWDGKIMLEGNIGCTRVLQDGSRDVTFQSISHFRSTTLCPDGRILGVRESHSEGPYIVERYNANGIGLDSSFFSVKLDGEPWTIVVQADGKTLVGGCFSQANGVQRRGVARLNTNGGLDNEFAPILGNGGAPYVRALAIQADGKVLLGGEFTSVNGIRQDHLTRLTTDGNVDLTFRIGAGTDEPVTCLVIQPDGKLIIGGQFTAYAGVPRGGIARLNLDGSLDPSFDPGLGFRGLSVQGGWTEGTSFAAYVESIALQQDGYVLVAGAFTSYDGFPRSGVVRIISDLGLSKPLAERQLPGGAVAGVPFTVVVRATPTNSTSVYAVEERAPSGWTVTGISHEGVFDALTGKVKFGPYMDSEPRMLTYVVTPPAGYNGGGLFEGICSADGQNTPVTGAAEITISALHPADNNPADALMQIGEVTAYGAAWRKGNVWPLPPNPIPIDYVTRAGALWRGGELYTYDAFVPAPPLWWVNAAKPTGLSAARPAQQTAASSPALALRRLPKTLAAGQAATVILEITALTSVAAYAVEELPVEGCAVTQISDGGELDVATGAVRWGPFLDGESRTLAYAISVPADSAMVGTFAGTISCDGVSQIIAGDVRVLPALKLLLARAGQTDTWCLRLAGTPGQRWSVQASSDLATWTTVLSSIGVDELIPLSELVSPASGRRFYRAVLQE